MKCCLTHYNPGDLVMYATEVGQLDVVPKVRVNFQGPYPVLDGLGDLGYLVQLDARGKQKLVHHDKLMPCFKEQGFPWAQSAPRAHKTKVKRGPLAQRTQDSEMSVRMYSCSPCSMAYKCRTCSYASEMYHNICIHVLQAHFEERDVPFKCQVCGVCKVTQG